MKQRITFLCLSLFLLFAQSVSASSSLTLGLSSINSSVYVVTYKPNILVQLPVSYEVAHTEEGETTQLKKPIARISVSSSTLETGQRVTWDSENSEFWDSALAAEEWYLNGSLVPEPPDAFDEVGTYIVGLRVQDSNGTWSNLNQQTVSVELKYVYNYVSDYLPVQGYQGWHYRYKNISNGTFGDLVFTDGFWQTPVSPYVQIYQGAVHPGDGYEPAIVWRAPRAGTVDVTLYLAPASPLSDGMSFTVYLRGTPLETYTFGAGDMTARTPTITPLTISAGDEISIHQNPLGTINSDAATLVFTISYHE